MVNLLMTPEADCHIDPEALERYAMGFASDEETARCEEHLLLCEACREALQQTESHITAMRAAAETLRGQPAPAPSWWSVPRLVPAFAGLALAAGVVFFRFPGTSQPPMAITVTATRGAGIEASVPAGRTLLLTPDLTALPTATAYRLEVVDAEGRRTWEGQYTPSQGAASVSSQRAGTHFIRIYSPTGELLREYGLEVKR